MPAQRGSDADSLSPTGPAAHPDTISPVLAIRRRQFLFRLGIAAATTLCGGPLLGWPAVLAWLALYAALQLLELLWSSARFPCPGSGSAVARAATLALFAANTLAFGSITLLATRTLGGWGAALSLLILSGSLLSIALTTIGSRSAMIAAGIPTAIYVALVPAAMLAMPVRPETPLIVAVAIGGALIVFSALRLWQEATAARLAEAVAVRRERAERISNEARLTRIADRDPLTDLVNRTVLRTRLERLSRSGGPAALLLVDLDGFKFVNDTLGHPIGDQVLRAVATRLSRLGTSETVVARVGGDEFAVLVPGLDRPDAALSLGHELLASISDEIRLDGQALTVGASIGVALNLGRDTGADDLFASADLALYHAKRDGRQCVRLFTPRLRDEASRRVSRDGELHTAFDRGEFELHYQPQVALEGGRLTGAEVLLRWRHPTEGLQLPHAFLPALHTSALKLRVGDWAIREACRRIAIWRRTVDRDMTVAVNLFGAQLRSGRLVETVRASLAEAGLPGHALELEITEDIILGSDPQLVDPLAELRAMGVGIAFDDYGTGYASLSLLKRFPLTRLKIDRSFVAPVCDHPPDATIVRAVVSMGRAFGLGVIAEGVSTRRQAEALLAIGCGMGQGHLFGRPVPADQFETVWARSTAATSR